MNIRRNRHGREGVALVLTLLLIVLLTVLVTEFAYEIQVDASRIGQQSSTTEAYFAARSAIALSMSVLAADLVAGESEAQQGAAAEGSGGMYDGLDEPWAADDVVVEFNESMVAVHMTDEYGKINLNALLYEDEGGVEREFTPLVDALRYLFDTRSREWSPVDAILDWLDADDFARPYGFENDHYQSLDPPIVCKNGPMDSLEELLLIPGVIEAVYFGEPDDEAAQEEGEVEQAPLAEVLTVHGHPEGRVNINTATGAVLEAMFAADPRQGGAGMADQVMQRLEETGPYVSREELRNEGILPALPPPPTGDAPAEDAGEQPLPAADLFDVRSSVFRILGDSTAGEVPVRVEAYVWRDTPTEGDEGGLSASGSAQLFRVIDWRVSS
jgi:type II secretory pathway component PulK